MTVAAPRERVWALLLDPKVMAGCVPGTQSVEVLSDVEYLAVIKVKISFISAKFTLKTTIVESRPPDYLRIEGTGEDRTVASSMKQTSELFLTELDDNATEMKIKVRADVMGRLGSFGLGIMKTKADRMWDEFGANFAAIAVQSVEAGRSPSEAGVAGDGAERREEPVTELGKPVLASVQDRPDGTANGTTQSPPPSVAPPLPARAGASVAVDRDAGASPPAKAGLWKRLTGKDRSGSAGRGTDIALGEARLPTDIYLEIHHHGGLVRVLWPASAAPEISRLLREIA